MKPTCERCNTQMSFVADLDIEEMFFQCSACNWVLYDFDLESVTIADIMGDLAHE